MLVSDGEGDCLSDVNKSILPSADENQRLWLGVTDLVRSIIAPFKCRLADLGIDSARVVARCAGLAADDLLALTRRDPAAKGSWEYVLAAYFCVQVVAAYRVANAVLRTDPAEAAPGADSMALLTVARQISEAARTRTGVEIHPAATIGPRFVVDHGTGTVIGEDVHIGADCYLLQGVVLGARGIADNVNGTRHPKLGDRVQVGGFARVLGPITVGDDVVIGSHALVHSNVPAGSTVSVLHQYQVVNGPRPITVYGVEALGRFRYRLHGIDLDRRGLEVSLLGPSSAAISPGELTVLQRNAKCLTVQLSPRVCGLRSVTHIRIRHGGSEVTVGISVGKRPRVSALPRSA